MSSARSRRDESRLTSLWASDTTLAMTVTAIGLAGVAFGVVTERQPFAMLPGMDGALTMGILGFAFALLHGIRYRDVLRALIPVLGIQIGGCLVHGESVPAIVGLELTVVGVVGLAMAITLSIVDGRTSRTGTPRRRAPRVGERNHTAMAAVLVTSDRGD